MRINRLLVLLMIWLVSSVAQANWSAHWPISNITALPTDGSSYSNYFAELYWATDERLRATVNGTNTIPATYRDGATIVTKVRPGPVYAVAPFVWAPHVPNYIGVTNDPASYIDPPMPTVRTSIVLTNGIWRTNKVVAMIDGKANVLRQEKVYVSSQCHTTTVYNTVHTNKVPNSLYRATGAAFDLLQSDYTTPNGDNWPGSLTTWNTSWFTTRYTPESAPYSGDPIYGWGATQTMTVTTSVIPYYLINPTNNTYTVSNVTVTATNYDMPRTSTVIGNVQMFAASADETTVSWTCDQNITLDSSYKVNTNDFGSANDSLLPTIIAKLIAAVPYYFVTTNADGSGSFNTFLTTVLGHKWAYDPATGSSHWTNTVWNKMYQVSSSAESFTAKPLPRWDATNFVNYSGAGTNLYTLSIYVNSTLGLTGGSYTTHSPNGSQVAYVVPGWQAGHDDQLNSTLYTNMLTVTNNNPQFLCYPASTMNVVLASYRLKPMSEATLTASGFSSVYWNPVTNITFPASITNVQFQPVTQYVTNYTWLSALNGAMLTRQTASTIYILPVGRDHMQHRSFTELLPYYTAGGIYVLPLVNGVASLVAASGHEDGPFRWWVSSSTGTLSAASWFITTNLTAGLDIAKNWSTLFGTNILQAEQQLQAMGYPTRIAESHIGHKSLGASGYYYPGGVLRPATYNVGVVESPGSRIAGASWGMAYETTVYGSWQGASRCYPYNLTYMPWDTLCSWPNAYANVSKATANTTTIPVFNLNITGDILYSDVNRSLYGMTSEVRTTATTTVSAPNSSTALKPFFGCILTNSEPDDGTYWLWLGPYSSVRDSTLDPTQQLVWARDAVWKCDTASITDTYYVAGLTNSTPTNSVITNANWCVALFPESTTLTVDLTKSAIDTVVEIVISNTVTLYSSTAGMINPRALDACYKAINALKYSVATLTVAADYTGWTNLAGVAYSGIVFGKSATEFTHNTHYDYQDSAHPDENTNWDETAADFHVSATGTDPLTGPDTVRLNALPVWTVNDNSWYKSGKGWITRPNTYAYTDGDGWYKTVMYNDGAGRTVVMDGTVKIVRNIIGWRGEFATNTIVTTTTKNNSCYHGFGAVSDLELGHWAINTIMYLPTDTNLDSTVDLYSGIGYDSGSLGYAYDQRISAIYANLDTTLKALGSAPLTLSSLLTYYTWTNSDYAPLAFPTSNIVQYYGAVTPADSLVFTGSVASAITDIQLSPVTVYSANTSFSYTQTDYGGQERGEAYHTVNYSVIGYKPYKYQMYTIEGVRKPSFKYHD